VAPDFPHNLPDARKGELMGALLEELRGGLRWLGDELGYELEEAGFPAILLRSDETELRLSFGALHGKRLALFANVREVGGGEWLHAGRIAALAEGAEPVIDTEVGGPADVPDAAARLSGLLERIRPALAGGREALARLRELDRRASEQAEAERWLETVRGPAADASRHEDWERVVELLGPLDGRLPRAEQMRLDLARRRLGP
jgi:hypothetical protein